MISIKEMLKADPSLADLSEPELEELRGALYEVAQLAFEVQWLSKRGSKNPVRSFPNPQEGGTI